MSEIPAVRRAIAMPAGTAAKAISPRSSASDARWLLLRVRAANGGRWDRAPDHARDRDQGQDVWERLEEDGRRVGIDRKAERKRGRRAEEQRRREGAERTPVAEDQRGERDEAAAGRHVLVERPDEAHREVRTAEGRQDARERDGEIPREIDRDADGL